ncbi:tetratricopeptide repeat protein [Candidatus Acetothermia bacterium]|nr:tetratricopeptide repeat protein [Candidatus Acetothermia bacterium]
MAELKVQLLGRFSVWRDGVLLAPSDWKRRKTQTLFKVLVSERGRVFTQDQLIEILFPDLQPQKAADNLYGRVGELRRALEPDLGKSSDSRYVLSAGRGGYCFSVEAPCWVDIEEFQKHIQSAQRAEEAGHWADASKSYEQAIALYQGDYLAEDLYEEWTLALRERWREAYLTGLVRLADCHARVGKYDRVFEYCQKAIELDPGRESAYRQKMLYHALIGELGKAAQVYQECVKILRERCEAEPSPETRRLHDQILAGEISQREYPAPALPARHNLPLPLTSFIGREREISEIKGLLSRVRSLTLSGIGGSGKTRLALRVAGELLDEYVDGVWLVDLSTLANPALVAQAVASALGVKEEPGRSLLDTLSESLKPKRFLLILDNCEHLIGACAPLAEVLLQRCSGLKILATSREALGFRGETIWQVPPLSVPDLRNLPAAGPDVVSALRQYESIQLFIERALTVLPSFAVTDQNVTLVAQVCRQLDGLPLAIELAAARMKVLSIEQLAARLEDRFRLLTGGSRTAQSRQQTLQAMMDWSFQLLLEKEKFLLRRLSIFAGGFTLEAAESVCGEKENMSRGDSRIVPTEILDLLVQLVEKSLVIREQGSEAARYRMLETVRQYGWERLAEAGEMEMLQRRHLDYFLELVEEAEPNLTRADQLTWLNRLETEHDNVRTALKYSLQSAVEKGLRLAAAAWRFWEVRGYLGEGRGWLEKLLEAAGTNDDRPELVSARATALGAAGNLARDQGDYAAARTLYEEALKTFRRLEHQRGITFMLQNLGLLAWSLGDYTTARSRYEESLQIWRALGNKQGMANSLNNLGNVARDQGDYARARSLYEQSLAITQELSDKRGTATLLRNLGQLAWLERSFEVARARLKESLELHKVLGDKQGIAHSLGQLGNIALVQGDYSTARSLCEQSLSMMRGIKDRRGIAYALKDLGNVVKAQGDDERATALYEESLVLQKQLGNKRGIAESLEGLAKLHKQSERAIHLCSAAEALREAISAPLPPVDRDDHDRFLATMRTKLGEKTFALAWAEGRTMTLDQAIEYALSEKL